MAERWIQNTHGCVDCAAHYRARKGIQSHDTLLVLAVIVAGYIALRRCQKEYRLWQERAVLRRAASDRRAAARARDDVAAAADAEIQQKREALRARLREQNLRKKNRKAVRFPGTQTQDISLGVFL